MARTAKTSLRPWYRSFCTKPERENAYFARQAQEGWHLSKIQWFRYVFTKGAAGEYVYQIDYQPKHEFDPESHKQIFSDMGWEVIGHKKDYGAFWVFLRRPKEDGIALYTDRETKLAMLRSKRKQFLRWYFPAVAIVWLIYFWFFALGGFYFEISPMLGGAVGGTIGGAIGVVPAVWHTSKQIKALKARSL